MWTHTALFVKLVSLLMWIDRLWTWYLRCSPGDILNHTNAAIQIIAFFSPYIHTVCIVFTYIGLRPVNNLCWCPCSGSLLHVLMDCLHINIKITKQKDKSSCLESQDELLIRIFTASLCLCLLKESLVHWCPGGRGGGGGGGNRKKDSDSLLKWKTNILH